MKVLSDLKVGDMVLLSYGMDTAGVYPVYVTDPFMALKCWTRKQEGLYTPYIPGVLKIISLDFATLELVGEELNPYVEGGGASVLDVLAVQRNGDWHHILLSDQELQQRNRYYADMLIYEIPLTDDDFEFIERKENSDANKTPT